MENRSINFRFWTGKEMLPVGSIVLHTDGSYHINDEWPHPSRHNGSALMQSTNLKDKNGKEIYEGDVLLIPSLWHERILDDGSGPDEPSNQLVAVKIENGCWGVEMMGDALFEKRFYSLNEIQTEITNEPIEVIGNIYENADLLKSAA